jgi:hypothetical protein
MRRREHEVALFVLDETCHDVCVIHWFWAPDGHFKASVRFWGARQPHMLDVIVGSKVGNQSMVPGDRCEFHSTVRGVVPPLGRSSGVRAAGTLLLAACKSVDQRFQHRGLDGVDTVWANASLAARLDRQKQVRWCECL